MTQKWTDDQIKKVASEYRTRNDFKEGNRYAYRAACRRQMLDDVCSHMDVLHKKWTKRDIELEARRYNQRTQFRKNSPKAYDAAWRNGILDAVCSHMSDGRKNLRRWNKKSLFEEAKKYTHRSKFMRGASGAWKAAIKLGILDEICSHMKDVPPHWDVDSIKIEAKKYNRKVDFQKNSAGAYDAALRLGVVDDVCLHMEKLLHQWTTEEILAEAKKYSRRIDFKFAGSNAYKAAQRRGILEMACAHMDWQYKQSDIIYVWRAKDHFFNGKPVYKIGVTTTGWGDHRIKYCAKEHGFECVDVIMRDVGIALPLEQELLKIGEKPNLSGDGATEFRALTKKEYELILQKIDDYFSETELVAA